MISHNSRFIFIHAQRTGGTTLTSMLKERLGVDLTIISEHGNTKTADNYYVKTYPNYFSFGFTRNPWERILSWYTLIYQNDKKNLEDERQRFEGFLESDLVTHAESQFFHYNTLDYFSDEKGKITVDHIGRYENYENELKSLFKILQFPSLEIPVFNATNSKNYADYYTDKSRMLITDRCKKDIEYFNYSF